MPLTVLLGALWGDEGKGRVSYELAREQDVVCRFNGGANASHTVLVEGEKFVLRQVPCGVFHPHVECVLGDGMVLDLGELADEIEDLAARGVDVSRISLSPRAHLTLPWHRALEERIEELAGDAGIKTTLSGIGPAYADKAHRLGVRLVDLGSASELKRRLTLLAQLHGPTLGRELDAAAVGRALADAAARIAPAISRGVCVRTALAEGQRVLAEGAQGALLDVDHGDWPWVTASHPSAGGALTAFGLPPRAVERTWGVVRAYSTRQSRGPLPSEIPAADERVFREATRDWAIRVGWLDLVALRRSCEVNGYDGLVVTKLDSLAGLPQIRVCVRYGGDDPSGGTPIYEELAPLGDVANAASFDALPAGAKALLQTIEVATGVPVVAVSTAREGPLLWANISR